MEWLKWLILVSLRAHTRKYIRISDKKKSDNVRLPIKWLAVEFIEDAYSPFNSHLASLVIKKPWRQTKFQGKPLTNHQMW